MKNPNPYNSFSLTRFSLNLSPSDQAHLNELTSVLGVTRTELIRKLIRNAVTREDIHNPGIITWLRSDTFFVKEGN